MIVLSLQSSVSFHCVDYFLVLCALVLIIQKEIVSSSIVWSNPGVVFFVAAFFFLFNSNFILLLFCKIKGEVIAMAQTIPSYFTATRTWVFLYLLKFPLRLFPTLTHLLPSPQFLCNSNHFWFISVFYGYSWCSPWDPRAITGFGTFGGWMEALPLRQVCFVMPASVVWEALWNTKLHQTGRPDGFVILKDAWENYSSCCEVHRKALVR